MLYGSFYSQKIFGRLSTFPMLSKHSIKSLTSLIWSVSSVRFWGLIFMHLSQRLSCHFSVCYFSVGWVTFIYPLINSVCLPFCSHGRPAEPDGQWSQPSQRTDLLAASYRWDRQLHAHIQVLWRQPQSTYNKLLPLALPQRLSFFFYPMIKNIAPEQLASGRLKSHSFSKYFTLTHM